MVMVLLDCESTCRSPSARGFGLDFLRIHLQDHPRNRKSLVHHSFFEPFGGFHKWGDPIKIIKMDVTYLLKPHENG